MAKQKEIDPLRVAQVIGILGGTEEQLSAALGISRAALKKRKGRDVKLVATLKAAKAEADSQVEKALFQRAIGFVAPDTHFSSFEGEVIATPYTRHYPPSEVACIFWLKNRKPDQWREKNEVAVTTEIAGVPENVLAGLRKAFLATSRNGHASLKGNGKARQ